MQNPLLSLSLPIDFNAIDAASVLPGITELTKRAKEQLATIANAPPGEETYESTLGAIEAATGELERAALVCEHLEAAANTPALREAWGEAQPLVSAFWFLPSLIHSSGPQPGGQTV